MKKLLGVLAAIAIFVGVLTLATPAPAYNGNPPNCKIEHLCRPEPDFFCPPCQYWDPCSPHCGCRPIPNCTP